MALDLVDLDERTRAFMLEEIESDVAADRLYLGSYLSPRGQNDYPALLRLAAEQHDDAWLAGQLRVEGRLSCSAMRAKPGRGSTWAKVPSTAAEMLAEGEFNRFYVRGLCRRAEEEGRPTVVVCRAKEAQSPRPEPAKKIGARIPVQRLLEDLRANVGVDAALGLPSGPSSGLSVELR